MSLPSDRDLVIAGDCGQVLPLLPDASFQMIYVDPPFNTGRTQRRETLTTTASRPAAASADTPADQATDELATPQSQAGARLGFHGRTYDMVKGAVTQYDDRFADYWEFLEPKLAQAWRLLDPTGTLYLHLDYRESHYAKVLLDALFGRDCFLNEIVWAYDYGGRSKRRWPTKHDTILVYVKDPARYYFDSEQVDREPYMAPGLVTPEKAARGKLPTDVWWHTIVSPTGKEKTGYPTQKPEGVVRRMVQASTRPGDRVLDFFAGSGTLGAVAAAAGRRYVLVDSNPAAVDVMRARLSGGESSPEVVGVGDL